MIIVINDQRLVPEEKFTQTLAYALGNLKMNI